MIEFPSLPDFFDTHQDDIFMFWVYRKVYTPYEQKRAFTDESVFEDTQAHFGFVIECISLGGGDFLLGFKTVADPDEEDVRSYNTPIEYYRLSEIRIGLYQPENKEE